ncbi:hypothetical protein ACFFIY_06090 [Bhargavaea ullalensis]|uniref:Uncharacterized protein n=1 Tax=Bhargavaea ullalensis TaxID=1265685 RepID=A0ABV2GC46_9BACL
METVSEKVKAESIRSFESTIRKTERAFEGMARKGANTKLIEKRLSAMRIGLAVLENAWYQRPVQYSSEELADSHKTLAGLLPSVEEIYEKSKEGSPQRTLLERRIRSIELALGAMDVQIANNH